jgi:F-type H+-transporting ATPase subunit b
MNAIRILLVAAAMSAASPAFAAGGGHGEPAHAAPAGHGAEAGHAAEGGHGAAEGGDHGGGHHYYTADDDHDGTANWLDSDSDMYQVKALGFHAINLLCLLALIGWFARKPIGDIVRERALGIRKELTDTARARDEAHQRHQELVARLDKLHGEIEEMEAKARAEAANEEQKLVERAEREAQRLGETAERNIRDEATRARLALRRDAVELAVKLAEGILARNVTSSDQQALARDFLQALETDPRADAPRA